MWSRVGSAKIWSAETCIPMYMYTAAYVLVNTEISDGESSTIRKLVSKLQPRMRRYLIPWQGAKDPNIDRLGGGFLNSKREFAVEVY